VSSLRGLNPQSRTSIPFTPPRSSGDACTVDAMDGPCSLSETASSPISSTAPFRHGHLRAVSDYLFTLLFLCSLALRYSCNPPLDWLF
jgi:hypothetical protein